MIRNNTSQKRKKRNDPNTSLIDVPHFLDPKQGWLELSSLPGAGSSKVDIWHSNDGGQKWTQLASNTGSNGLGLPNISGISFKDAQTGIAAGTIGAAGDNSVPSIALTRDGGQSWQMKSLPHLLGGYVDPFDSSLPPVFFGNVLFLPVTVRVQDGNLLILYRSNDGGQSWVQTSAAHIQVENTYLVDVSHAYATDKASGKFYSTSDGGNHWLATSDTVYGLKALSFPDAQNGWGLTNDGLLHTTDAGKS